MRAAIEIPVRPPRDEVAHHPRDFRRLADGRIVFTAVADGIRFELSRLRWSRDELWCLLTVECTLAGARTSNGRTLHVADFNVSSASGRVGRAKILREAARTGDAVDWTALVEELCQRTLEAENVGDPIVALADVEIPTGDDDHHVDGFVLPRRDSSMLVSDGGKGKSGLALYVACRLVERGERVLICDYETDGAIHKRRAEGMFGEVPAGLFYQRCSQPFIHIVDAIRRQIVDQGITWGVLDSVVPACHDKAEDSAVAAAVLRAQRATGIGWLNIAHVPKSAERGQERPFGSQFWWNEVRSVWVLESQETPNRLVLACHHRKSNNGPKRPAVGFEFLFDLPKIHVSSCNVADVPELAEGLPLWMRIRDEVRNGALTIAELSNRLDAKQDTIAAAARRKPLVFQKVLTSDGIHRIGLAERRAS